MSIRKQVATLLAPILTTLGLSGAPEQAEANLIMFNEVTDDIGVSSYVSPLVTIESVNSTTNAPEDLYLNTTYGVGDSQSALFISGQLLTITPTTLGTLFNVESVYAHGLNLDSFGPASIEFKGYDAGDNLIASLLLVDLYYSNGQTVLLNDFNALAKFTAETFGNVIRPVAVSALDNLDISEYVPSTGGGDNGNGGNTVPEPGTLGLLGLGLLGMGGMSCAARRRAPSI